MRERGKKEDIERIEGEKMMGRGRDRGNESEVDK